MHRPKSNQNWKRIYRDNPLKMASVDGVHLTTWKTYPRIQCAHVRFNPACKGTSRAGIFRKIVRKFEMCVQFLNNCNVTLTCTVSHPKKIQGVAIIFKHFYKKFFFSRAFQVPLKSNIKFQGFSRTSRSSTDHGSFIENQPLRKTIFKTLPIISYIEVNL